MELSASPRPRKRELRHQAFDFPIVSARRLPVPVANDMGICEALAARRSSRSFARPLEDQQLSFLLWHTCRRISAEREASGFVWQHRVVPSAGGRHPVHPLIIQRRGQHLSVGLYIAEDHRLAMLQVPDAPLRQLIAMCDRIINVRSATVIWFGAEVSRTASKYINAESLIWRDAGALLSLLNLIACAAGMSFCALGPSGEPFVSRLLSSNGAVEGVGGCVVGNC